MFARASTAFVLALPLLAAASAIPRDGGNQCNVGAIQCCNSSQTAESLAGTALGGLLGLLVGPIEGLIGLNCSPITVIGASGSSCTAQPVCCTNNNFNGLVALGCTPININL